MRACGEHGAPADMINLDRLARELSDLVGMLGGYLLESSASECKSATLSRHLAGQCRGLFFERLSLRRSPLGNPLRPRL